MAGTAGLIAAVDRIFKRVEDDQIIVMNLSTVFTIKSMIFFAVFIADITALRHISCVQYVIVGCDIIGTGYIIGTGHIAIDDCIIVSRCVVSDRCAISRRGKFVFLIHRHLIAVGFSPVVEIRDHKSGVDGQSDDGDQ